MKAILFNIFGGITRTDDVANGIVTATKQIDIQVPIVIRLTGTNEEIAVKILAEAGFTRHDRHGRGRKEGRRAGKGGGPVSIFIDQSTKLIVQGITGRDGSFHAKQMMEYGTQVVAGVTPGKGGQTFEGSVPIFNTVQEAMDATGANSSVIYVPPAFAADAMFEAADAGVGFIVCITEGVPVLDMTRVYPYVKEKGARLLGANCPGLLSAGKSKVGIIPGHITQPGPVGLVSKSRDADLRGGLQAQGRRDRDDDVRGHRRRPGERHAASSTAWPRSRRTRRPRRS